MNQSTPLLQNEFLQDLRENKTLVSVFLVSGIRLRGYIDSFDTYVVALKDDVTQLVYKHAISTVIPAGDEQPHPARKKESDENSGVVVRTKRSHSSSLNSRQIPSDLA